MSCALEMGSRHPGGADSKHRHRGWYWGLIVVLLIGGFAVTSATLALAEQPPSFVKAWGSFGSGPGQFFLPSGIAVGPTGDVYVCDSGNHRIQKFDNDGNFLLQWGGARKRSGTIRQSS